MARLVVADTGPINYLVLIGCINLLPVLFGKVVLPEPVLAELSARNAPQSVRKWVATLPGWLEVREISADHEPGLELKGVHAGEQAVIRLATALKADLLLMDDRRGVSLARSKGLRVTGTLGILELASRKGLTDFPLAIEHLRKTNFRSPDTLLEALMKRNTERS